MTDHSDEKLATLQFVIAAPAGVVMLDEIRRAGYERQIGLSVEKTRDRAARSSGISACTGGQGAKTAGSLR